MAKGNPLRIDPFYPDGHQDFLNMASSSKCPSSVPSATSTIFPYLRRLDTKDDMPSRRKNPLLTLKLSSPSFLDSTVNDGLSDNPLYKIKTGSTSTTVLRYDPWEGPTNIANIRWPLQTPVKGKGKDDLKGVFVQTNASRTKAVEHFLKYGKLSGSRSFTIPNYPHTFKWKRSGPSSYHCTTSSVKGPVATLDGAESSVPPRIRVYEALLVQDTRPQLDRGGVSLDLLDHLLITALLLVTDAEEWVTLARPGSADGQPHSVPASVRQWRKIVYGEPLFPSLRSSSEQEAEKPEKLKNDLRPESPAKRPASMRQMRKIVFGEPLFPSLSQSGGGELAFASRSSTPMDDVGSESSEAESIGYPSTPICHGHLDPSFYEKDMPPIPEPPPQSTSSSPSWRPPSTCPSSSLPPLSSSSSTHARRDLPKVPLPPPSAVSASEFTHRSDQRPLHRSRSTPFLNSGNPPGQPQRSETIKRPSSQSTYVRADSPPFLRGGSRIRKLPKPPKLRNSTDLPPVPSMPTWPHVEKLRPRSNTQRSLPEPPDSSTIASSSESAQERYMRRSMEKEANELADWVESLTPEEQQQHHRAAASSDNSAFDPPPPAYYAIDFSHPPHASAPSSSSSSELPLPPLPH